MARVILITGTRKGIGRGLAEYYLQEGWKVVGCSRGGSTIDHPEYLHFNVDVGEHGSVLKLMTEIKTKFGGLNAIVNNAAAVGLNHSLTTPSRQAQEMVNTNIVGCFNVCQEGSRLMIPSGRGRIVNFTSAIVPLSLEGHAVYHSTKCAVEGFSRVLARELGPLGITVNCVGPSMTDTDALKLVSPIRRKELMSRQAVKRETQLGDITNAVDFFLSEKSEFVTGQTIYLGGLF